MTTEEKELVLDYMKGNRFDVVHNCVYGQSSDVKTLEKTFPFFINIAEINDKEYFCIYDKDYMVIVYKNYNVGFKISYQTLYDPNTFVPVDKYFCEIEDIKYFKHKEVRDIYDFFMKNIIPTYER